MRRRYTIHKDGDLLVEELDDKGQPIDPEPVPPEERLNVEVVISSEDSIDGRALLLELLEMAFEMEAEPPQKPAEPKKP